MKKIFAALLLLMLPVVAMAAPALYSNDLSGTITTGNTFQTITPPAGARNSIEFQNICSVSGNCTATTNLCYINFGSATATLVNSIVLQPGQLYLRSNGAIPNDTIKITCNGTGDKFMLKMQ